MYTNDRLRNRKRQHLSQQVQMIDPGVTLSKKIKDLNDKIFSIAATKIEEAIRR